MSKEVGTTTRKIQQVATISANNDNTIGTLIAEAMVRRGKRRSDYCGRSKGNGN